MNLTNQWVNSSTYVWKPSNGSFVTAYASANTITISSLPDDVSAITTADILWVVQYNSEWQLVREFHRTKHKISVSWTTITVENPTPLELNLRAFEPWDLFVVYTNIPNWNGGWSSSSWASAVSAEYSSPTDFSATYTGANTITLWWLPFSIADSSQLAYIKVIPLNWDAYILVNGSWWITMTVSSNIVTVSWSDTSFASWDVYQVWLNAQKKAFDPSTNSEMNSILNPTYSHNTDSEVLVTAQDLTTSYADFGPEIDVQDYDVLTVNIVADCNNSEDVTLKILALDEMWGADEYELESNWTKTLWSGAGTDFKKSYSIDTKWLIAIQLQAVAGTVWATAWDLSININKA